MKICLYTETALPMVGGQELVVDALAREYMRAGHEVVVLAPPPRSSSAGADPKGYKIVRHPRFVSTWRFVDLYRFWLQKLHRRFAFDIVHCHSVHPAGYLAVLSRPKTGAPVVITSHGGDVNPANRRLEKPGARAKHAWTLEQADALVSISRFTREGYLALAPSAGPIHDIPNGVHVEVFANPAPRPAGLDPAIVAGSYLLFLGRLAARKGVDLLIRSQALRPSGQRTTIVVAGSGEERAALEAQAREAGLADTIRFVGRVEGSGKTYLLQNALAVIMPSRDWEAFPLVLLEAFACGKPVIATRVPGLEDLVEPGRTGWLVEPESPEALARAMGEITAEAIVQRGANALSVARQHDWPQIAARYIALFETTLSLRGSQGAGLSADKTDRFRSVQGPAGEKT